MAKVRVNKQKAKRLYHQGVELTLLPCNVPLNNLWIAGHTFNIQQMEHREFDKIVNSFEFYNCSRELGRYTAFYVEETLV